MPIACMYVAHVKIVFIIETFTSLFTRLGESGNSAGRESAEKKITRGYTGYSIPFVSGEMLDCTIP